MARHRYFINVFKKTTVTVDKGNFLGVSEARLDKTDNSPFRGNPLLVQEAKRIRQIKFIAF